MSSCFFKPSGPKNAESQREQMYCGDLKVWLFSCFWRYCFVLPEYSHFSHLKFFSALWVFEWISKSLTLKNSISHTSHLNLSSFFTPLWTFMWYTILPFWVNNFPQYSQLCAFSVLCTPLLCKNKLWTVVKVFLHWSHWCCFSMCTVLMCAFIRPTSPNGLEQCLQVKGTSSSGWLNLWVESCSLVLNVSEQIWQIFGLIPLCINFMCMFILLTRLNVFRHSPHFQGRSIIAWYMEDDTSVLVEPLSSIS